MREPSDARRQRILAVVRSRGSVRVADLAAELEVSVVTVRRDVEELARAGRLRRGHGVARSLEAVERPPGPAGPVAPASAAVALVVPERHTYLYETMHGARTVLEEAGLRVALHIAAQAAGAERPLVERALADGAGGLLIAPRWSTAAEEEADYAWLARLGVPTVVMERRPRRGSALHAMDSVCSDHWYGMHLAVEHLVSLGHRRIVLAARDDSPTARTLRSAFAEIARDREEIEDWTVMLSAPGPVGSPDGGGAAAGPEQDRRTGSASLAALLQERRATAAVLHGDVDALMLVQQLADSGVRVPQDCSVVAYDDVVAAFGSTPLTAVAPPKAEVGRVAAELLVHRLAGGGGGVRRVELLPELKARGSARKP
ncbi:substrate-binding domain-containing protein [Streptomyces peucetius]|uniref:Substrate-binding domain-containing protein n=1 Tax=Streptomyces peucetius TaxID=1950 RepID=A0ABY6IK18_STRPE|nr:substrate-binding domain-containing protein [Streptomyces peucetius]UYQ66040.1 substrate-binding domain-containing protein [Streptomyces peucetius]